MSEPCLLPDDLEVLDARSTLGTLLLRVAAEIETGAKTAADLQSALSPLLARAGAPQAGALLISQKIQGLDLLEQTLRDLGTVLGEVAAMPVASQPLDSALVLSRCKLNGVVLRLGGDEAEAQADDLELF